MTEVSSRDGWDSKESRIPDDDSQLPSSPDGLVHLWTDQYSLRDTDVLIDFE